MSKILLLVAMASSSPTDLPDDKMRQAIIAFAETRLKDPSSAQWKWQPKRDDMVYCGWINSKNSYGGYTGTKLFLVNGLSSSGEYSPFGFDIAAGNSFGDNMIKKLCAEAGYRLNP